jgi:NtrC-family two-component system sensor histidine kinase KinB
MWLWNLHARFILAGSLLVAATLGSSTWSAWTLNRLNAVVNDTLRTSQETIDRTADLASSLEREDDALLLFLTGNVEKARADLASERRRGDGNFKKILATLKEDEDEERAIAADLRDKIERYRVAGDDLLAFGGTGPDGLGLYHRKVNPLLRQAVSGCDKLREANFQAMQETGLRARDEAGRGTRFVLSIALATALAGVLIAAWLTRSVLRPIRELTASVEAIRQGNFDRRVAQTRADELGQLAAGFNRMAEALAEYRQSRLGELLTAKATLESTLNALPDAVFVFGPDGDLAALNPPASAVLAAKHAGPVAQLADLPFSDEHRAAVKDALAGRLQLSRRADFERTINVVLDGHPRRFILTAVPIPDFAPRRFGAVVVLDDVTEFARLDQLRSDLIGIASHELKSPLTALRMNLLMLDEGALEMSGRQRQLLAAAVQGCEELGLTIEEFLDVTRIEAGQLRLNVAPLDLGSVLAMTRRSLQSRFEDASITLAVENGETPLLAQGDPARLTSVFANVLTNALKYSPRGGIVMVALSSRQNTQAMTRDAVRITVTDQGPGIPEEYRERVFEKFFRVEHQLGQRSEGARGTGIGLYLCREILKAHGGTITCEPGADGFGTRFVITLPSA